MSSINTNINTNKTLETNSKVGTVLSNGTVSINTAIQSKTIGNLPSNPDQSSQSCFYVDPVDSISTMMFNTPYLNVTMGHGVENTGRSADRKKIDITTGLTANSSETARIGAQGFVIAWDPINTTGTDLTQFIALSNQKTPMTLTQNNVLTIFDPTGKFTIPNIEPISNFDQTLIMQINDTICRVPYKYV